MTPEDRALRIEELLIETRQLTARLASARQTLVDPAIISFISKTPYKFACYREGLVWRATELAQTAVEAFAKGEAVSGTVLCRSVVEVAAAMGHLYKLLQRQIDDGIQDDLDDQAMRMLLGSRDEPDMPQSINVMSMITSVEKVAPGFAGQYARLSEVAHPNWTGTCGAFSKVDRERIQTAFTTDAVVHGGARLTGLLALAGSLHAIIHWQSRVSDLIAPVARLCEAKIAAAEG